MLFLRPDQLWLVYMYYIHKSLTVLGWVLCRAYGCATTDRKTVLDIVRNCLRPSRAMVYQELPFASVYSSWTHEVECSYLKKITDIRDSKA